VIIIQSDEWIGGFVTLFIKNYINKITFKYVPIYAWMNRQLYIRLAKSRKHSDFGPVLHNLILAPSNYHL
jgi:hypothetical protein